VEQVEAQARRMLMDPKARNVVTAFHDMWFQLYKLDTTTKDATLFPDYADIRSLLRQETQKFADYVFWDTDSRVDRLLVSDTGIMNAQLAQYYGLPAPTGSDFGPVPLAGSQRFGLLTQASILSEFSNVNRTSPTRRGKFVRAQLLCMAPPPPPANVPPLDNSGTTADTIRERLAQHTSNPACSGCHHTIDPIGFALENYDTSGKYRTMEAGAPVDATGELSGVTGMAGPVNGALELSQHVAGTAEYPNCVATQWFHFALGRQPGPKDACALAIIKADFKSAGEKMRELMVTIAKSNAFFYIATEKAP
jgi:hypothetical protein